MIFTLIYKFNENINKSLLIGTFIYIFILQNKFIHYYSSLLIPLDLFLIIKVLNFDKEDDNNTNYNLREFINKIKHTLRKNDRIKKQNFKIDYTLTHTVDNILLKE